MASELINKTSINIGAKPNLVPGSVAVNWRDEIFFMRADGRVVEIPIDRWESGAATRDGAQVGAPLSVKADGSTAWDPAKAPSSVIDGAVRVDAPPPANVYGVPGVQITGAGADAVYTANTVITERFYVASDTIMVDRIAAYLKFQQQIGALRLGLLDDNDAILLDTLISTPLDNAVNTISGGIALGRGHYKLCLWSEPAATFGTVEGLQAEQGWTLDAQGDPEFALRERGGAGLSSGMDISLVAMTEDRRPTPGVNRILTMRWTLPG